MFRILFLGILFNSFSMHSGNHEYFIRTENYKVNWVIVKQTAHCSFVGLSLPQKWKGMDASKTSPCVLNLLSSVLLCLWVLSQLEHSGGHLLGCLPGLEAIFLSKNSFLTWALCLSQWSHSGMRENLPPRKSKLKPRNRWSVLRRG